MTPAPAEMVADVSVVGRGIIALTAAIELADRGLHVRLVGTTHSGNASSASGGMLAPSVEREMGPAHDFAIASRDFYPGYVAAVSTRSGRAVPLNTAGILELPRDESEASELQGSLSSPSSWIDAPSLQVEEPALAPALGAVFHPRDGCVDPLPLLDALATIVAHHEHISTVREDACSVHAGETGCTVTTDQENRLSSDYLVLAAGAWTAMIEGAGPAVASVAPVRGQMLAYAAAPLRHVIYGAGGYLIPRGDGRTVAGSTMEHVGFEVATTSEALESISSRASMLCPALAAAAVESSWAGLRPCTPDLLPVIGADPERRRVIYACGHSRNGILLAPLTAEVVADLVTGTSPRYDISQFRPGRS